MFVSVLCVVELTQHANPADGKKKCGRRREESPQTNWRQHRRGGHAVANGPRPWPLEEHYMLRLLFRHQHCYGYCLDADVCPVLRRQGPSRCLAAPRLTLLCGLSYASNAQIPQRRLLPAGGNVGAVEEGVGKPHHPPRHAGALSHHEHPPCRSPIPPPIPPPHPSPCPAAAMPPPLPRAARDTPPLPPPPRTRTAGVDVPRCRRDGGGRR